MISVICPVWNRADFLVECVAPLMTLPKSATEFIFVDDASTDQTPQICSELIRHHGPDRIIYVRLNENAGAQVARNRGIAVARGDYLMFADSDDVLVTEGVRALLTRLKNQTELDFVYGKVIQTDENLNAMPGRNAIGGSYNGKSDADIAGYHWHTMGALYRRRCIEHVGSWNTELCGSQDWEYQARVKLFGGIGQFVDVLVGYWRQHEGQRVGTDSFRADYVDSVMLACDSIYQHAKAAKRAGFELRKKLAIKLLIHALEWGANKISNKKRDCISQSLALVPDDRLFLTGLAVLRFSPGIVDRVLLNRLTRGRRKKILSQSA